MLVTSVGLSVGLQPHQVHSVVSPSLVPCVVLGLDCGCESQVLNSRQCDSLGSLLRAVMCRSRPSTTRITDTEGHYAAHAY